MGGVRKWGVLELGVRECGEAGVRGGEVGSGRESVGCDSGEVERERVGVKVWSVKLEGEIVGIVRVGEVGGGG